jgi:uncharacterized RDD family membrane protein YckC
MPEPTGTQYAGFLARLLAFLADAALVFVVCAATLTAAAMALGPDSLMPVGLFVSLFGLLYWPVMHASGVQGTIGKAIVGLKVTRFDGQRISIVRSVWRELSKVFSSAILMLGYLIAAVLPRKQALHDLLAATYVVREGPPRAFTALLIAVSGFALPVAVVPMLVDAPVMKRAATMAEELVSPDLMKQVPVPVKEVAKQALGHAQAVMRLVVSSIQDLMKPSAPPPPTPKVAQKPAPTPPVAKAPAAKPKPPAEAAKPAAVAEWKKPPAEPEAGKLAPVIDEEYPEPLSEAEWRARLKPPAKKVVVVKRPVPPPPPSSSKTGSGPRYNDLMTAVTYGDVASVNELLKLGRWPDKPDSRGMTPLMVAAETGDLKIAEVLLRGGATARPAIRVAEQRGDAEMVRLLKRYASR